jgi:hypothetical protein
MNQELYNAILAGAKTEGKRICEAIEAAGSKDKPLSVRPPDSERYYLEVDFRDGEVSLRSTYGAGRPEYVHRGDAAWFGVLGTATSHLGLPHSSRNALTSPRRSSTTSFRLKISLRDRRTEKFEFEETNEAA